LATLKFQANIPRERWTDAAGGAAANLGCNGGSSNEKLQTDRLIRFSSEFDSRSESIIVIHLRHSERRNPTFQD
jgi:hypothetical protein